MPKECEPDVATTSASAGFASEGNEYLIPLDAANDYIDNKDYLTTIQDDYEDGEGDENEDTAYETPDAMATMALVST